MSKTLVVAQFRHLDKMVHAVEKLRDSGAEFETYSPYPDHHIEDEKFKGKPRSPVRMVTLAGAMTGCLGAFLMTSWMSVDYPVRVSAKPLLSFPAFVIPGFECTILIGGLCNLLAIFLFCKIPSYKIASGYRGVFSEGTYGVVVNSSKEQGEELKKQLESMGAEKVELEYAR
jgi:molybdopterin-containing oxidoreductase family membrane subunit